ncbi:MAG: LURP-one-related/scramblase family protein [Acetivibrionales bacterium]|jgi:uncharacterized protein YxjI|nr:hypothetical protein [Clostridiaceae bacterium]
MRRLYIKQKVFSIRDRYSIFDEQGQPVFNVEGKIFSFGAKIHLYDAAGMELLYIEQKLFRFLPEYHIYSGNTLIAVIKKEFSLFKPKLNIQSQFGDYSFIGNLFGMDFSIVRDNMVIGELHKVWLSWGDSYELIVENENDVPLFCALSIAIDHCIHNESDR